MPKKCRVMKAVPPTRIAADFLIDDKQIQDATKTNYYTRLFDISKKYGIAHLI